MKLPQPKYFTIEELAKYWTKETGEEITLEQIISYGRDGTLKFRWYFNGAAAYIAGEGLPDEADFVVLKCEDLWEINVFDETANVIFQKLNEEEDSSGEKLIHEIKTEWSSKGFSLPQGVEIAQIKEVRQKLQSQRASLARDIAIKCAQQGITLENLKSSSFRIDKTNYPELFFCEWSPYTAPFNSIRITVSDNKILQEKERADIESLKNNLTESGREKLYKIIHALTLIVAENNKAKYLSSNNNVNSSAIAKTLETKGLSVSRPDLIISDALKSPL